MLLTQKKEKRKEKCSTYGPIEALAKFTWSWQKFHKSLNTKQPILIIENSNNLQKPTSAAL